MDEEVSVAAGISLVSNQEYICGVCSCGAGMLFSVEHCLRAGFISCNCGTEIKVDSPTVELLWAEEELRLQSRSRKHGASIGPGLIH